MRRKLALCYPQQVSKNKIVDAVRLAAKWDSMVAHFINIVMTKKLEAFSAEKKTCVM